MTLSKLKKWLPYILAVAGIACLALAIILLAVTVPAADARYKRVLGTISAILFLILALLIAYYLFLMRDTETNYFLFDRKKKRNIPVEELTFTMVNERMTFFLTLISSTPEQLWQEGVLEDNSMFGYKGVYKPLVAYKMLFDLADKDIASYWNLLRTAPQTTIDSLCEALIHGGEQEMVKALRYILENYRDDENKLKTFVKNNERYIRGRMLAYVKRYIELFY